MSFAARVVPSAQGLAAEFYAHCARGELRIQRCTDCGAWRHPPRVMCARCGSERWQWTPTSGRGRLYTWTVTHQALVPAFADDVSYAVAVVQLEEGVRLVTAVTGTAPAALEIGMPLEVAFVEAAEGVGLHHFRSRPA